MATFHSGDPCGGSFTVDKEFKSLFSEQNKRSFLRCFPRGVQANYDGFRVEMFAYHFKCGEVQKKEACAVALKKDPVSQTTTILGFISTTCDIIWDSGDFLCQTGEGRKTVIPTKEVSYEPFFLEERPWLVQMKRTEGITYVPKMRTLRRFPTNEEIEESQPWTLLSERSLGHFNPDKDEIEAALKYYIREKGMTKPYEWLRRIQHICPENTRVVVLSFLLKLLKMDKLLDNKLVSVKEREVSFLKEFINKAEIVKEALEDDMYIEAVMNILIEENLMKNSQSSTLLFTEKLRMEILSGIPYDETIRTKDVTYAQAMKVYLMRPPKNAIQSIESYLETEPVVRESVTRRVKEKLELVFKSLDTLIKKRKFLLEKGKAKGTSMSHFQEREFIKKFEREFVEIKAAVKGGQTVKTACLIRNINPFDYLSLDVEGVENEDYNVGILILDFERERHAASFMESDQAILQTMKFM